MPAINLASTGLVFTNGDSFHVLITLRRYDDYLDDLG